MIFLQVNLHKGSNQGFDLGANKHIATPIYNHIDTIYKFTLTILFIIAILVSHRIYTRWQLGDQDILPSIIRWFFGLLICFSLIVFLKSYISSQNFGVYSPITF